ncbi:MAG: flagellar basal body L-ring protein FlgH [Erythrobacter sp.]|jgi:flagellar L-ring protein precursor FlgH|nr:flagellar basal body L-ring protein FlgH [Erythrobacter sp.]
MSVVRFLLAAALALFLAACAGERALGFAAPPPPGGVLTLETAPPQNAEASANVFAPQQGAQGSIFQASQGYAGLVTGTRARQLGDMVTILLIENTATSKSTTGATDRTGGFALVPPTGSLFDFIDPADLNASGELSFNGGGNAAQQSQLTGRIAVTIAALYPNGTAEVVGEKQMNFSQGDEWVQFAGRIRLVDIDVENRLRSDQVANARIIYSGKGAVQRASRPGWLSRFFGAISPF